MIHIIINTKLIPLYVHSNGVTIGLLVVTGQGISNSVTGYHRLPSEYIKLTNINSDACTLSWVCYGPRGDQLENVNFITGHHGHSGVHMYIQHIQISGCV